MSEDGDFSEILPEAGEEEPAEEEAPAGQEE
jgi:hypothetical protein